MANVTTAVDFATIAGGLASQRGRIDLGTITGDTAIAAPTLITHGFAFPELPNAIVSITAAVAAATCDLWAGYVPRNGLPGAIRWVKVIGQTQQVVAAAGSGGWVLPAGRPDRIAVQVALAAGATFQILVGGAN